MLRQGRGREGAGQGCGIHDTLVEVVQVIEEDEPDVQPAQGDEEGKEEQTKPKKFTL